MENALDQLKSSAKLMLQLNDRLFLLATELVIKGNHGNEKWLSKVEISEKDLCVHLQEEMKKYVDIEERLKQIYDVGKTSWKDRAVIARPLFRRAKQVFYPKNTKLWF